MPDQNNNQSSIVPSKIDPASQEPETGGQQKPEPGINSSRENPSVTPNQDIPPMPQEPETSNQKLESNTNSPQEEIRPKKTFGGKNKKMIFGILGFFVLAGSVAAGVVLVRQTQLFQQKARIVECLNDRECPSGKVCKNGSCVSGGGLNQRKKTVECLNDRKCPSGKVCKNGSCVSGGGLNQRKKTVECLNDRECPSGKVCQKGSCVSGGGNECPSGWRCDKIYTEGTTCQETWPGSIQQACKLTPNSSAANGTCCIPPGSGGSGSTPTPKPTPTNPPGGGGDSDGDGGGATAQCFQVKAYDTSWNLLTTKQLSSLKTGDKVRFAVTGSTTKGSFDKAKFIINNSTTPEVTAKNPNGEFYYEYTIPAGTSGFNVKAKIHHTSLGWSS